MAVALALGAAGALWVIFRGDLGALLRMEIGRGEAIYFWGCAAHAAYTALVRRLNRGESAVVSTFLTMAGGTVVLTLWAAPALRETDWAALPGIVWVTLAYVSIAATASTTWLVQFASLRLPAAKVMAYTYLVPSWVILWELALHGSWPPALVGLGVLLTCAALALRLKYVAYAAAGGDGRLGLRQDHAGGGAGRGPGVGLRRCRRPSPAREPGKDGAVRGTDGCRPLAMAGPGGR